MTEEEVITISSSEEEDEVEAKAKKSTVLHITQLTQVVQPKLVTANGNGIKNEMNNGKGLPTMKGGTGVTSGVSVGAGQQSDDCILLSDSEDEEVEEPQQGHNPPQPLNLPPAVNEEGPTLSEIGDEEEVYDLVPVLHEPPVEQLSSNQLNEPVAETSTHSNGMQNGARSKITISNTRRYVSDIEVGRDDFDTEASEQIQIFLDKIDPKYLKTKLISAKDHVTVTKKVWKKYGTLSHQPVPVHTKLAGIIKKINSKVSSIGPEKIWKVISDLVDKFDMDFLNSEEAVQDSEDEATTERKKEERKQKKIQKLETKMNKIDSAIQELENKEVDLENYDSENDHNSPYMQSERLKKQYMKAYYLLCEITGSSKLTGRPVQRKIDLSRTTKYPEFEKVVQDFINSQGYLFVPDFSNIWDLVLQHNKEAVLNFDSDTLHALSKELLEQIISKIKSRRGKDFKLAFPQLDDSVINDPADYNSELSQKLKENKTLSRTEDEVLDSFVGVQSDEKAESKDATGDENPDVSPLPSENEDGTDDDEDDVQSDTESSAPSQSDILSEAEAEDEHEEGEVRVAAENEPLFEDEEDEHETAVKDAGKIGFGEVKNDCEASVPVTGDMLDVEPSELEIDTVTDEVTIQNEECPCPPKRVKLTSVPLPGEPE